jgi:hypothetical protein
MKMYRVRSIRPLFRDANAKRLSNAPRVSTSRLACLCPLFSMKLDRGSSSVLGPHSLCITHSTKPAGSTNCWDMFPASSSDSMPYSRLPDSVGEPLVHPVISLRSVYQTPTRSGRFVGVCALPTEQSVDLRIGVLNCQRWPPRMVQLDLRRIKLSSRFLYLSKRNFYFAA